MSYSCSVVQDVGWSRYAVLWLLSRTCISRTAGLSI